MTGPYEIVDDRFKQLVLANVGLQKISTGHLWVEGPVWFPNHGCLLFSDIPNEKIYRWMIDGTVNVFRERSEFANGNTRDGQGRLITCQHGTRSVTRTEHNGRITTLVNSFEGKKLNSPNDVVAKSDGTIWFTDPTYGILSDYEGYRADPELLKQNVFCFDPKASLLKAVASEFAQPNGLAFSPDETKLYIAESGHSHDPSVPTVVRCFDVSNDNDLLNGCVHATISKGIPDGLRVDCKGNLWVSAADGVHCVSPDGTLLGKILVPETVSNLAFGGARGNMMFITATTSVYALHINTHAQRY